MNLATVSGIVIAACGALIIGMAGLIKTMIVSKLDAITRELSGVSREVGRHGERITRLEEWRKFTEAS